MRYRRVERLTALGRAAGDITGDVDEEIAFHLEMRTRELERSGLSESAAREQAQAEFGDVAALRRSLRATDARLERRRQWWWLLTDAWQDVRFAVRSFARAPAFTAVAVATLALGIGASVAIFTVVDAVVLRPLPYAEPERLVMLHPGQNANIALSDRLGSVPSVQASTGLSKWDLTLTEQGEPSVLLAQTVDAAFFDVFGVRPALGRAFRADERDPERSDVVVLSHRLWQTRFGGDAGIVGRRIALDGAGHGTREVIGVMPEHFVPPLQNAGDEIQLWTPLTVAPGRTVATDSTWFVNQVVARLAPGATVAGAAAEVRAEMGRVRAEVGHLIAERAVETSGAQPLQEAVVSDVRRTLLTLLTAVGLVLLLVCANLANLLLARGDRRRHELTVRTALGGTRGRLVRELLTESAVLAVVGGGAGMLLAQGILHVLRVADASGLPRLSELSPDVRVLAFAIATSVCALLAFALLPALRVTARAVRPQLGASGRSAGRSRTSAELGRLLVGAEVALAMVLVTGAGLLLNSLRALRAVEPGLDHADVLAVQLSPPPAKYRGEAAAQFYDDVMQRLRALPGVSAVGAIHLLPFTGGNWSFPYLAEGHAPPSGGPLPAANFRVVTPGYFDAVDMPVLLGRAVETGDRAGNEMVGVINRRLAEQLWPGEDPTGRIIRLFGNQPFRVIGVVGDVHQHALDNEPRPEMYIPFTQWTWPISSMVVMVETSLEPAALAGAVQRVVWEIDPRVPVDARPLTAALGESMAQRRFFASVLTFFGLLALLLGAVGVYGVMSYAVAARTSEFGVRIALGATGGQVVRSALAGGLVPVIAGLVVGAAAALATGRLLSGALYGVGPRDPATLLASAAVLGAVATLACWIPARRVRSADPVQALRE